MREQYFLGITSNYELAFGEFEVQTWNGYPEFSASFFTVRPVTEDDVDAEEYYEEYIQCSGKDYLYDCCVDWDCRPSELVDEMMYRWGTEVPDILDCSYYPKEVEINRKTYYFESSCGGQHDLRKDGMEVYIDNKAFDKLMMLWDKYHLKKIDDKVLQEVKSLEEQLYLSEDEELNLVTRSVLYINAIKDSPETTKLLVQF